MEKTSHVLRRFVHEVNTMLRNKFDTRYRAVVRDDKWLSMDSGLIYNLIVTHMQLHIGQILEIAKMCKVSSGK